MDQLIYSLFLKKKFVKSVTQKGIVELTHYKMSKKIHYESRFDNAKQILFSNPFDYLLIIPPV